MSPDAYTYQVPGNQRSIELNNAPTAAEIERAVFPSGVPAYENVAETTFDLRNDDDHLHYLQEEAASYAQPTHGEVQSQPEAERVETVPLDREGIDIVSKNIVTNLRPRYINAAEAGLADLEERIHAHAA